MAASSASWVICWQMPTTYCASAGAVFSALGLAASLGAEDGSPFSLVWVLVLPQAARARTIIAAMAMQSSFFIFIIFVSFSVLRFLGNKKTAPAVQGEGRCR